MTNEKRGLKVKVTYVYTAEFEDEELKLKTKEDFRNFEKEIEENLNELFLREDGRAEQGILINVEIEIK